ncbi:MAG: DNA primase [Mollicutes bacterium]|nr:DNA primase [Mollicutes bacterium]
MIPSEEINRIRNDANIVDIISSYINLEPKGKNFFGLCPFHEDHNPSMSVSPDKQIYTCFVCGASGNVFTFVQNYENVTFPEAVSIVASKIGYNLKYQKNINQPHKELYEIIDISTKYFVNNLNSILGKEAKEYLKKRQLNDVIVKEFNIGVALGNNLSKLLLGKGFTEKQIIDIGIANKKDDDLYDIFQNRITFPINNERGEPIAFSARVYNMESPNKYLNSKENPIFKKGNVLFNYDKAKNEVNKSKSIIIVEGHIDAIRVYSIGVKNVVATMGTALTKEHITLLKKLNAKIILMFDNDEAGLKGTIAIGEELIKNNLAVEVVRLSEEKDPDSYILRFGPEKFKELLKKPQSFFEFKLQYLRSNKDLNKSKDLANYINGVIEELNKSDDDILKEVTINKLCSDYNLDKEVLLKKLTKKDKVSNSNPIIIKKTIPKLNKYQKVCEAILYMMMKDIKYLKIYDRNLGYIPDKKYNQIANDILACYKLNQEFNIADFISFEVKSTYYDIVLRIINQYEEMEPNYEEFDDYLEAIKKWIKEEQINKLKEEIDKETDINRQIELNDLLMKLKKESE